MQTIDDLIVYNVTDAAIEEMKKECFSLKVLGLEDKKGYELVYNARIEVKNKRVEVEKKRKELKADSLEFGRRVDAEAKRITEQLLEVENYLQGQQDVIDNEKKRLKEEAELKARATLNLRIELLQKYKAEFNIDHIAIIADSAFDSLLSEAKSKFEHEEIKRREEQERLARLEKERAEQAQKIKAQEEENYRLQSEIIKKQQAEIAEKERQLEEKRQEKAKAERAEAERIERERQEKIRVEKIEAERIAKEHAEKQRLARLEAERIAKEAAEKKRMEEAALEAKRKAELAAAKKVADKKLFDEIKKKFPTVESAWVEIARLIKKHEPLEG